jgi:hypothetical protein
MEGTSIAALALLGTFISKLIDFLKYLSAKDVNAVVTQLCVWAGGIGGVILVGASELGDKVGFEGITLQSANGPTKIFFGMMVMSLMSKVYDFQKAHDNAQSAATPSLIPGTAVVDPATGAATTGAQTSHRTRITER